jgi:hypothetical protein
VWDVGPLAKKMTIVKAAMTRQIQGTNPGSRSSSCPFIFKPCSVYGWPNVRPESRGLTVTSEQDACRLTPFTNRRNISAIQISPSPQNLYFSGMHMHGDEISITRRTLA